MPTEKQVNAAIQAIAELDWDVSHETLARVALAALAAAEAVAVAVAASNEDEDLLSYLEEGACAYRDAPEVVIGTGHLCRLLVLARRGAGQVVPDEAATRADERERIAVVCEKVGGQVTAAFIREITTEKDWLKLSTTPTGHKGA